MDEKEIKIEKKEEKEIKIKKEEKQKKLREERRLARLTPDFMKIADDNLKEQTHNMLTDYVKLSLQIKTMKENINYRSMNKFKGKDILSKLRENSYRNPAFRQSLEQEIEKKKNRKEFIRGVECIH